MVLADQCILRQVIEQRGGVVEKQRQVIFDAVRCQARADILVQTALGRVALEFFAEVAAESVLAGFVQREFARRQQADILDRVDAALGVRVEGADALDLVVEQVDAVGQRTAHREQVDDAAAHAVFAGAQHLGDVGIAGQGQLAAQGIQIELGALLQEKSVRRQKFARRQAVKRGGGGNDGDIAGILRNLVERRQPLRNQVLVRGELVIGQGFPVRQQVNRKIRREIGDFVVQALGVRSRFGEDDQRSFLSRQLRQCQGIARALKAGVALARSWGGKGEA